MTNIVYLQKASLEECGLSEKHIENEIVKNPSILGLGDLVLIERQRTQPTNGRLDLLFQDPESITPRQSRRGMTGGTGLR